MFDPDFNFAFVPPSTWQPGDKSRFKYKTLLFDIETDGLLDTMTTIHCLVIRQFETGQVWRFRRNKREDTIEKGIRMLEDAAVIGGHNIQQFDVEAIRLIFPDFDPQGVVRDSLVMARVIFAEQKQDDYRLWKRGKLPGQHIGGMTLEAWGHRLGLHKGDYKHEMEAEAKAKGITDPDQVRLYVWGTWNQRMDDYCLGDVDVTTKLWQALIDEQFPVGPIDFEHDAHSMAIRIEENGFPFDIQRAEELAEEMERDVAQLSEKAIAHYGAWVRPAKKKQIRALWEIDEEDNEKGAEALAKKVWAEPNPAYGEDDSRAIWGEVTVAKATRKFKSMYRLEKDGTRKLDARGNPTLNNSVEEGVMFCAIEQVDFKPTSRAQIIDRFTSMYGWEPKDFTDKGNPSVNDVVLKNLAGKIPMAHELAEIFYLQKRIGQIKTGANAWLKKVEPDGAIHHRLNVGGTVSGRCSHSSPNIAQVPKVLVGDIYNADGSIKSIFLDEDEEPIIDLFKEDGDKKKKSILYGRAGRHGYESRRLFYVPDGWTLVGCDLSGIELRCLANLAAPFDNGFLINQIMEGDIHTANMEAAGLKSRDQAKTFIYALIYGAGDAKIGSIVAPLADRATQVALGKKLKAQFFERLPGLAAAVKKIAKQARQGWVEGLDGRKLYVRAKHAALNLRLQSDGAVIAKKWMLSADDAFYDAGLKHGWDGDYAFLAFVHDELQVAVRNEHVAFAEAALIQAAADAGDFFDFAMPVDAEAKHGINWAETH